MPQNVAQDLWLGLALGGVQPGAATVGLPTGTSRPPLAVAVKNAVEDGLAFPAVALYERLMGGRG